ncbi:MAG: sulfotransferase [Burkholderiales bacterium]|jgi:hypothetical protein|nr:sulfotransferase [Burkholderiales bacterium]
MEFVIGIGSQRAGSTLMHKLLESSSNVFMHPLKELHYFDTLYGYRSKAALQQFSSRQIYREMDRIITAQNLGFINDYFRCYVRANLMLAGGDVQNIKYLDLFRPMIKSHQWLGEITPEYMLFDEPSIEKMRDVIGENARIVLVCRDPVDRFISSMKLMNTYNQLNFDSATVQRWVNTEIDADSMWIKSQDGYNDYEGAMKRFTRFFKHVAVYDYKQLVSNPASIAADLVQNLGLEIDGDKFCAGVNQVVNALGDNFSIDAELRTKLEQRYAASSDFMKHFFGGL